MPPKKRAAEEKNDLTLDIPVEELEYEDPGEDLFEEEIFFDEEGNDNDDDSNDDNDGEDDDDDGDAADRIDEDGAATTATTATATSKGMSSKSAAADGKARKGKAATVDADDDVDDKAQSRDVVKGSKRQSKKLERQQQEQQQRTNDDNNDDDDNDDDADDDGEFGNADDELDADEAAGQPPKVWLRSKHGIEEDEELTYEASAYDMLHALRVDWPCLSIAVLGDALGQQRRRFPHTAYAAGGTQADASENNKILLLKMSDLHKTKHDDDSDSEVDSASDDDADEDATIVFKSIRHVGSVNRLKAMPQANYVLATWSETARVHIWDAKQHIEALDNAAVRANANAPPLHTITAHRVEGYALDWSSVVTGRLLSGDGASEIRLWERQGESGVWTGDATPFRGHTASVEDLQWSPVEADVFASCSVDRSVKVWDARTRRQPALSFEAHASDVNVIAWNKRVSYLVVSGADDGSFRIWDLRQLGGSGGGGGGSSAPAAHFQWHTQPICSVEWSPDEDSMIAVACAEQVCVCVCVNIRG